MSAWALSAVVLIAAGMGPVTLASARGESDSRLVALELAGGIATGVLLLLCQISGQSSYFIVPLVLAVLAVTGVLVFTRLVEPGS